MSEFLTREWNDSRYTLMILGAIILLIGLIIVVSYTVLYGVKCLSAILPTQRAVEINLKADVYLSKLDDLFRVFFRT